MGNAENPSVRFRQWLEHQLSTLQPGSFFPTDRELARTFGISKRTVYTVLKPLADQGRVMRIQGKGTCVPAHLPARKPTASPSLSPRDTIVTTIKRDIFNGTLKTGDSLPPRKRYCIQFGVESRTVSKAYQQLVDDNLVVRIGRRYWVGDFSALMKTGLSRDIFFLDCTERGWRTVLGDPLYGDIYRRAEHVLTTSGFRVLHAEFHSIDSLMRSWSLGEAFPQGLLFAGMQRRDNHRDFRRVNSLFERYCKKKRFQHVPSVVIVSPSRYRDMNPLIRQVAGTRPTTVAREAARLTVSRHCTSATVFFNETLSGNRSFYDYVRLLPELRHLRDDFDLRFVVKATPNSDMDSFLQRLQSHYPGLGLQYFHRCLDKYGPVPLAATLAKLSLVERFDESFQSQVGTDVWLFSNDGDAVEALRWCAARGVDVPGDRAVMGFENNPDFFSHGITSCILDKETIGYNLAHCLLNDIPVEQTTQGFVRMKARVLERATM